MSHLNLFIYFIKKKEEVEDENDIVLS